MKRVNEVQLGLLVGQKNYHALRKLLNEMNAIDVAQFIEALPEEQMFVVFRTLQKSQAMDVFAELGSEAQQEVIESITDNEISALMDELAVDDAVDMLEEFPAALVTRVLQNSPAQTRALINEFLLYPENSAGSIMTAEYTSLRRDITVEDAIMRIRKTGEDRETVYTCYVIDSTRRLEGVVSVKDLLLAHDSQIVEEIMYEEVIAVATTDDQEAAAKLMAKYGLISLPVIDTEKRLVGIVTVDDALDVLREETTEDFEKMAGMAPSEKPYMKTGVFKLARNRFVWLLVLMVSSMITATIIGRYELAFAAMPLLVSFITVLTDTGGNAGSQSSTLVIRGMALGEITMKDFFEVMWKEFRVSLMVGVPLATINLVRITLTYRNSDPNAFLIGLTVSIAMLFTVVFANIVGGILPMFAKVCKLDPALMAAPLISTLVDACSLLIYFGIAMTLLPI